MRKNSPLNHCGLLALTGGLLDFRDVLFAYTAELWHDWVCSLSSPLFLVWLSK